MSLAEPLVDYLFITL